MPTKIVVAMSGGVDSSVAAALLKEQGHEVIGISMQLWNHGADAAPGSCCSVDDFADARRVAAKIGIPFYILNLEKEFRASVVDYFVAEYQRGRTPIPCTLCNQKLKFHELFVKAEALGCELVATGHYAALARNGAGRLSVRRGRDRSRDQSYFLFNLAPELLARALFPLGDMEKAEVRSLARRMGLPVAEKAESREICFVPDDDYAGFLERQGGVALRAGDIVDAGGNVLGTHRGAAAYTVGQRKGLSLGGMSEPQYVTKIDSGRNVLTVGPKHAGLRRELTVANVNWYQPPAGEFAAATQIRYRHPGAASRVTPLAAARAGVIFDEPQLAVTPGQAAVFYRDELIVGGGWIE